MPHVRPRLTSRRVIGAGVAAVLIGSSAAAIATTTSATPTAALALPSIIPGWLHSAKVLGATPADQTVHVLLTLKDLDPAGEHAYGVAASTPGNPLYRQWLSKGEFEQRFGAVSGAAATVTAAMKAVGATGVSTDALGLSVSATMPAALAETVFGVSFEQVEHAGQAVRVATSEPKLPAGIASLVTSVDGLTEHPVHTDNVLAGRVPLASVPRAAAATNTCVTTTPTGGVPTGYFNPKKDGTATVASTYYDSATATDKPSSPALSGQPATSKPYITSGYTPQQIRGAYGLDNTSYTGKGVTIGVALFYDGPDVGCDLATYSTAFGLPAPNYTDLTPENQVTTTAGGTYGLDPADAAGEQTLDVEAIHQMAPDAAIDYSGAVAPENETIYPALTTLIAAGVDAINNSYGGTGETDSADAASFETLVTDPAMSMGVGIDFSSGDAGDDVAADGTREADFPSTSDGVTAVGGTGIEIGAKNDYEGEFYWGTYTSPALAAGATSWGAFQSEPGGAGGGGGLSTAYAEPTWQQGVVPAEETTNADTANGYNTANGSEPTYGVAGSPGRVTPDVAMIADSTTGILVGETQQPDANADGSVPDVTPAYSYYRIGGTSVSSPIFTGLMADVDQALGKSAGFVNPTMYKFEALNNGAFRDPHIGRSATGSRLGSTAAQVLSGATTTGATADPTDTGLLGSAGSSIYTGAGPGVVPVVAEVRPDYTDTGNDGIATTSDDPTGTVVASSTPGNPVIYHLRAQGVLGTLEDLPGYDDSTGLGSPCAPQFINDFLPGQPSAGSYCLTPVSTGGTTTAPAPAPVTVVSKPTNTVTTSCTSVRGSTLKVYGPSNATLNKHGQASYSFKLFVNLGTCKTPSAVGRQFYVYVDGKKAATLRTGKGGVQSYLVRLKPGRHTITASFPGNKDLKKSASPKFTAKAKAI